MGGAHEQGLEGRGREVDALIEHEVEEPGVSLSIARHDLLERLDRPFRKEQPCHAPQTIDLQSDACRAGGFFHALRQPCQ